ncbi:MAG: hypothetical protein R3253_17485, partial [Longimicrobiales bacterium]|nr:hypothetical protein [Longimicrobiales bacterium]
MERSLSDAPAIVRLVAGHWSVGDTAEAEQLTRRAIAANPGNAALRVAQGLVAEGQGDHALARDQYLAFLRSTGSSSLADAVLQRIDAMRGETAEPIVARLLETGAVLSHGQDASLVVAIPRVSTESDDPEATVLAAAATEMLVADLRRRALAVLDWEISEAARRRLASTSADELRARMAALLSASVVDVRMERIPGDSLAFDVSFHGRGTEGRPTVRTSEVRLPFDAYPATRHGLTDRVLELVLGAEVGSIVADSVGAETASLSGFLALGEGIVALEAGDWTRARDRLRQG